MGFACIDGVSECTGCASCHAVQEPPVCPICEKEADTYVYDMHGELVGCDECIQRKDAWEVRLYA